MSDSDGRVPSAMSRVLVIKHGAFGDIIQAAGALADIRAHHGGAEIVLLTTPAYRSIFERCPSADRVLLDARPPRWRLDLMLALRSRLRSEGFDQVYDLQHSTRTTAYRRWIFHDVSWSGPTRGRTLTLRARAQTKPSLQRMADQLRDAGVMLRATEHPDVSWMADDVSAVLAATGVSRPFVVLIPGSSARHPEKRWPRYRALATALRAHGFDVVTAPGPGERDLAESVGATVLTGTGRMLDWFQLAGLFRRAAFVVGNDTGPTHLAAHVGAPGLALFGPHTTPEMTGILRDTFGAITVSDLAALDNDQVLAGVLSRLA